MGAGSPPQLFPIKALDGAAGYSRWKESILLRLRTLGLAHVLLSDAPPAPSDADAAARWESDDALCRGHILHTLSDRVFALRDAYEAVAPKHPCTRALAEFEFSPDAPILEQLAEFAAAAVASGYDPSDAYACGEASSKLGPLYPEYWVFSVDETMDEVWRIARLGELYNKWREEEGAAARIGGRRKGTRVRCYNCGGLGHMARNCRR